MKTVKNVEMAFFFSEISFCCWTSRCQFIETIVNGFYVFMFSVHSKSITCTSLISNYGHFIIAFFLFFQLFRSIWCCTFIHIGFHHWTESDVHRRTNELNTWSGWIRLPIRLDSTARLKSNNTTRFDVLIASNVICLVFLLYLILFTLLLLIRDQFNLVHSENFTEKFGITLI